MLALVRLLSRFGSEVPGAQVIECRVDAGRPFASSRGRKLHVRLAAWQGEDGKLRPSVLTLERPFLANLTQPLWRLALKEKTVFRALVAPVVTNPPFYPTAQLIRVLGPGADADFAQRSRSLVEPTEHVDPHLGTFSASAEFPRTFEGSIDWLGKPVTVAIERGEDASTRSIEAACRQLRAMQAEAASWQDRAVAQAEQDLYAMWVEYGWNGDGPVIPPASWRQRLELGTIDINSDDTLTFVFNDGDLFWGHWVAVHGNSAGAFEEAVMEG